MDKTELIKLWDDVSENFGQTSPKYWNYFGERLIKKSKVKYGDKVVDIGMGRGASLLPASTIVGGDGLILGLDISRGMIETTKKEVNLRGYKNITLRSADASCYEFEKNYFDHVVFGFSLGHFISNSDDIENILSSLKHGGEIAICQWGVQEDQDWLTQIVDNYLNNSKKKSTKATRILLNNCEDITEYLKQLGFMKIRVSQERTPVIYLSKEQWWEDMWNNAVRGIFTKIQQNGEEEFQNFINDVNKGLDEFMNNEGITFNMNVIYAYAEKK